MTAVAASLLGLVPALALQSWTASPADSQAGPSTATYGYGVLDAATSPNGSVAFADTVTYDESSPYTTTYGIMAWTGSKWIKTHVPTFAGGGYLGDVAVSSGTQAWALAYVGKAQTLEVLHWNGTTWSPIALPKAEAHAESGVIASTGSTVLVGGGLPGQGPEIPFLLEYNGSWKTEKLPTMPRYSMIQSIYAASPTAVSMVADACTSSGCTSNV
ncbi:MAG TPA: hypothetical protein VGP46_05950, partial [Acidimicrobiales bacterium]|nr:hypothetical protein [Acidimicrobiales bacterium]